MKYLLLTFFVIALSCNQQSKEKKNTETTKTKKIITEKKENIKEEITEKSIVKTKEDLIVVLKNSKNVTDAKALIENSSLIWQELVIDENSLKAAIIKVPIDKKDFWLKRLKESNTFSSVEFHTKESVASIKYISENTFVKVRKTHCSGDCAVYDVILFKDGKVAFNGIENVLVKGTQEFNISEAKMKKIKGMFEKTSFGTYLDSYVDRSIMDFPSTFITHNNKQIEIKLWRNVPLELALAYEAFEDILYEKKLIE
ncbi:DUF6438 domain-containing protein [Polaribacter sp. Hel1_85]|uniref:DUF6438 domain-containing protein n=1 Tax=Polaribacter sp. Hel1_85 TaxID=1250005 RepID=UPI00052D640F|nr:DUF6438 domain-containing protein [Polaribacter sp. Hel1_85]KGL63709.1 hypothetical protein PHEL85_0748 [Polaribacter sp. Hel1_85]